jgi:hypothetical protein
MCRAFEMNLPRNQDSFHYIEMKAGLTVLPSAFHVQIATWSLQSASTHPLFPVKLINISYFAKRASMPTLISRSLVEGLSMIPVSSNENLFCASFLNSSTVAYPCFCAIAGAKLIVDN